MRAYIYSAILIFLLIFDFIANNNLKNKENKQLNRVIFTISTNIFVNLQKSFIYDLRKQTYIYL